MADRTDLQAGSTVAVSAPRAARPGAFFERHFGHLLPLPAGLCIALLIIFPLAFNVYMSLQTWFVSSATPPKYVGLRNFVEIFGKDARFWNSMRITVEFTVIIVVLELVLGLAGSQEM
jgi:multiple sugar transport system permease protein